MNGRSRLRSLLFRNLGFKLLAFFLAAVVWFYFFAAREGITIGRVVERTEMLPVKILARADRPVRVELSPSKVEVTVSGAPGDIEALAASALSVLVDLTETGEGTHTLLVRVDGPEEIMVVGSNPASVSVSITEGMSPAPR